MSRPRSQSPSALNPVSPVERLDSLAWWARPLLRNDSGAVDDAHLRYSSESYHEHVRIHGRTAHQELPRESSLTKPLRRRRETADCPSSSAKPSGPPLHAGPSPSTPARLQHGQLHPHSSSPPHPQATAHKRWFFFQQTKRTKKVGVTGKYGTVGSRSRWFQNSWLPPASNRLIRDIVLQRYGASLRKQIKKMEVTQHARYTCTFCGKVSWPLTN
jgi:hypothetical protein